MKIWIIKEGEALPFDSGRKMRMGQLADYMHNKGDSIIWWVSTYIHGKKEYRFNQETVEEISPSFKIIMLHSKVAYKKNISINRIIYGNILAREFEKKSQCLEKPDIILCSWPYPQFAEKAVEYGKKHKVPVIIDVRDLWPDIFVRALPKQLQWLGEIAIFPMLNKAKRTFSRADGIVGVSTNALEWACSKAGRIPSERDKAIFIGSEKISISNESIINTDKQWGNSNFSINTWNICFIGTLSNNSLDIETVIMAVKKISKKNPNIRFIIGGDGDGAQRYKKLANGCDNIIFLGWLDNNQMSRLLQISKCGVFCYRNLIDFKYGFGNKIVQYMSAGLPVINSTTGFAKDYISDNQYGYTYEEGNVDSCLEMIERLYMNENTREKMAKNSYEQFIKYFETSIVCEQFRDYLVEMKGKYSNIESIE